MEQSRDLTIFNLIAASVLIGAGSVALIYLIPAHVPVPGTGDQGLSARFMPTLAAAVTTMLAVILGANVLIRMLRGQPPMAEDNEDNDVQGFGIAETLNALALLAGSAVYLVLLQQLGFVVASGLGLFACMYLGGLRNWWVLVGIPVIIPFALAQMLWHALFIILPPFPHF